MSDLATDQFRDALLAERERVKHALDVLHKENSVSVFEETGDLVSGSADDHLGDSASETHDRELEYGLEDHATTVLGEIDAALRRIDDGTYGICQVCGQQIDAARLEARPWAALCIDDQRRQEHA